MKFVRFSIWLTFAFIKKNLKVLLLTSLITFLFSVFFIYTTPIVIDLFFQKKETIGMVKKYSPENLPEEIAQLISNPLLAVNQKGEIVPVLVKSWEIFENGKKYRFHLKDSLYWSDNKKFISKDLSYRFQNIKFMPIDDLTFDFLLDTPLPILPYFLTKPVIKDQLIGLAGLYTVSKFKLDDNFLTEVILRPKKNGFPIKIYKFYETEDKMVSAYKKGEIQLFKTYNTAIKKHFESWKNTKIDSQINFNQILTLFLNLNHPLLKEKNIRKSLAYMIPDFSENGQKAFGSIPPTSWAFRHNLKNYYFSEEKALSLFKNTIKEATETPKLELSTYYDFLDVAQLLKKNFEKIGLRIDIKIISTKPDSYDLFLTFWEPPLDPDQYYLWHSTQKQSNITNFVNLKVDKLLEEGRQTLDLRKRKEIYSEFQEIIIEEIPAIFIYHPYVYTIKRR